MKPKTNDRQETAVAEVRQVYADLAATPDRAQLCPPEGMLPLQAHRPHSVPDEGRSGCGGKCAPRDRTQAFARCARRRMPIAGDEDGQLFDLRGSTIWLPHAFLRGGGRTVCAARGRGLDSSAGTNRFRTGRRWSERPAPRRRGGFATIALMQRGVLAFLLAVTTVASPSWAALSPESVRAAAAYSASHGGASLLVLQAGKTLHESGANAARKIYSGTKAFWCLAALAAAQDGLLGLDDHVADTIPAWREDPRKERVTIRQLLDFSCGLDPGFRLHGDDPGDRDAIALRLPMVAEPGTAFIYGPSPLQVFHAVLKAKLHGRGAARISRAPGVAPAWSRPATLPAGSRRQSAARVRLAS